MSSDTSDSKPFDLEANQDEIALFELREEVRKNLPPVSEIAQLAALISHGRSIGLQTWETYVDHAIYLWGTSFQKREDWITKQAHMRLLRRKAEIKEAEEKFPRPKNFPVSFDDFLRLALPKKRPEDRMKLYRDLLRDSIRHSKCYPGSGGSVIPLEKIPITTDAEIADVISKHRATGYDEFQYRFCVTSLQNFAGWHDKQNLKKRARSGAAGKWKRNSPEK